MKQEKYKILVIVILLGICCFLTYYFHAVLEIGGVFTHLFYLPILLSTLWWRKKSLLVAIFLAVLLLFSHHFLRANVAYTTDCFRALMFMVVAIIVARLSEQIVKMNQTLQESEEKFRTITSSAYDAIIMRDNEGKVIFWNKAAEKMFGYGKQEIMGKELHTIIAPQRYYQAYKKGFSKFKITGKGAAVGKTLELTALRKDGTEFPVELSMSVVKVKNQWIATGFIRDITERKQAEEALVQERNLRQALIDNIPDSVYFKDDKNRFIRVNKAKAELSGTTPEKMIGKTDFDFFLEEEARKAFADDNQIMESNKSLTDKVEKITHADGKEHWFSVTKIPRHNEKGQVIGTMGVSRDITERKRIEKELARYARELKHSNEKLEQFAYVTSHDLQEPLRMIVSYLQLLSRRYQGKLDSDADEFIGFAVDGGRRLQNMISDLLVYSRVGTRGKEFAPVNCENVLKEVLTSLQIAIEESNATITHDPLPMVMADVTQLSQLWQNLIINAIKYRGENSPLIHLAVQSQDNEWLFSVKDNGIGIDPKYSERIFGIFQRLHTREEYAGTGIGLAVCQRIVQRHGGRIWVKSKLGKGSTFYFTIPIKRR